MSHEPTVHVGLTDSFAPDVKAMIMAKYSRDISPIASRLPDSNEGSDTHRAALKKYYVGYGHKSIAQCATTDVYLEGISLIAAKAVENHPLFNGQECSTRYIDMTNQPCIYSHQEINEWQQKFIALYTRALAVMKEMLKIQFPLSAQPEDTKESVWENTINARAFDICRGILPAGITTNVGMSITFDTLNDHFAKLMRHPTLEVPVLAAKVFSGLQKKYPDICKSVDHVVESTQHYHSGYFYNDLSGALALCNQGEVIPVGEEFYRNIWAMHSNEHFKRYTNRPKHTEIDPWLSSQIRATYYGVLDFGSYRDIQRHRNGFTTMPILTPNLGVHTYYLDMLTPDLAEEFIELFKAYQLWYKESDINVFEKQYSTPIGACVAFSMQCDLNQALYVIELRSAKTVHQTLRELVIHWANQLSYLTKISMYVDCSEDNFTLKRGTQTFIPTQPDEHHQG